MKKTIFAFLIAAVLCVSMFACMEIPTASATPEEIGMICSLPNGGTFAHDETVIIGSSYHWEGFVTEPLGIDVQARLLRTVGWITNYDFRSLLTANEELGVINQWVKTQTWHLNFGQNNVTLPVNFLDTLDLTNLNYGNTQAPDTWVGVEWKVGYAVEYKFVRNGSPDPDAAARTPYIDDEDFVSPYSDPEYYSQLQSTIYIGHNELPIPAIETVNYGVLSGSGGTFQETYGTGYADGNQAAGYGYSYGTNTYLQYSLSRPAFSAWDYFIPPQSYHLWIKMNCWSGQPSYMQSLIGWGENPSWYGDGLWRLPSDYTNIGWGRYITDDSATWYDMGAIPNYVLNDRYVIIVANSGTGSGILWVDSVQLVPVGQSPYGV